MRYRPSPAGRHDALLKVWHNDPRADEDDPEIENPFLYQLFGAGVVPEMDVTPNPIQFGSVPAGDCRSILIELRNSGGADLDIHSAILQDSSSAISLDLDPEPGADGTDNIPTTLAWGEATTVGITCCPSGYEPYVGQLNITSNHLGQNPYYHYIPDFLHGRHALLQRLSAHHGFRRPAGGFPNLERSPHQQQRAGQRHHRRHHHHRKPQLLFPPSHDVPAGIESGRRPGDLHHLRTFRRRRADRPGEHRLPGRKLRRHGRLAPGPWHRTPHSGPGGLPDLHGRAAGPLPHRASQDRDRSGGFRNLGRLGGTQTDHHRERRQRDAHHQRHHPGEHAVRRVSTSTPTCP